MWPVRPEQTSSYDGCGVVPPAYPTEVDQTPGHLPVDLLGAPEAAEPEDRDLEALGDLVGDERARRARGACRRAWNALLGAAGQGLVGGGHSILRRLKSTVHSSGRSRWFVTVHNAPDGPDPSRTQA